MKSITVVAAVIQSEDKTLCVQRGPAKYSYISEKWEFPGGKVETGETPEEALIREIKEELHLSISVDQFLLTVDHTYPDFHLTMHSFLCSTTNLNVVLTEHINYKWLMNPELNSLDWAAADLPIVDRLIQP